MQWLTRRNLLKSEVAELLEVHKVTMSQWLSGAQSPRLVDRLAIQRLTGIPIEAWLAPEERELLDHKMARLDKLAKTRPTPDDIFNRLAGRIKAAS